MGLEIKVKRAILRELALRYKGSAKKGKAKLISELVALTGYNRNYSSWLFRNYGRRVVVSSSEERMIYLGQIKNIKRRRVRAYDEKF